MIDIQRQLKEFPLVGQEDVQAAEYVFAERVHAIDTLFTFATSSTREECQRRVTAINALIALCKKQESRGCRRRRTEVEVKEEHSSVSPPQSLSETLSVECKATQCIFCLRNENLLVNARVKTFAWRPQKALPSQASPSPSDGQPIVCPHPRCDAILNGIMLLQNHAEVVHKTPT